MVDTVSQIIISSDDILQSLKVDVRRVGVKRIFDYQDWLYVRGRYPKYCVA